MILESSHSPLRFHSVPIRFEPYTFRDIFARKNNKTLEQTVAHRRYRHLAGEVARRYAEYLGWSLGTFLLHLKTSGDLFYLRFLNHYGDLAYCTFSLTPGTRANAKGVYLFTVAGELAYIGRCRDAFTRRVNQGYGKIHPKNCFLDGQATNCHLNSLIAEERSRGVGFWVHEMEDDTAIEQLERELIARHDPPWNIALRR